LLPYESFQLGGSDPSLFPLPLPSSRFPLPASRLPPPASRLPLYWRMASSDAISPSSLASAVPRGHRSAVFASFLGWTLDAFDFFLVVFALTAIAKEFHKTDAELALTITVTLAFRPVGAFIFGLMADRYGRRIPLMIDLVFFSIVEVLSGFAPNYTVF